MINAVRSIRRVQQRKEEVFDGLWALVATLHWHGDCVVCLFAVAFHRLLLFRFFFKYFFLFLFGQQNGQAALPDGRVRTAVRGGAGVLGPRLEPSGALLLDDLHFGEPMPPINKKKAKKNY